MKGGQHSGVTQMEVEQAKTKLEETMHLVNTSMDNVIQLDIERSAQLKALVEAQAKYAEKQAQLLRQLSTQIDGSLSGHQPRQPKSAGPTLINNNMAMNSMGMGGFNSNQQFQDFNSMNQNQNQGQNQSQNPMQNPNQMQNPGQNMNQAQNNMFGNPAQNAFNSNNNFGQAQNQVASDPWGSSAPQAAPRANPVANNTASFDPWGGSSSTVPQSNVASTSNAQSSNMYQLPPASDTANDPFNLGERVVK